MFRLNILAIFSLLGLIILNVSKARSAKIKELDLASGLKQLQFLRFTSPRTFKKLSKWFVRIQLIYL